MNANEISMHETVCLIGTADRYVAHAEIDRQWKDYPRNGQRFWKYGIVQIDDSSSIGIIRTDNPVVGDGWHEVNVDNVVSGIVLAGPKKVAQYGDFRRSGDLFFEERLSRCGNLASLEVSDVFTVAINKNRNNFTMPARFARFSLDAFDLASARLLMLDGIGGARAFGLGMIVPEFSKAYPVVETVASVCF